MCFVIKQRTLSFHFSFFIFFPLFMHCPLPILLLPSSHIFHHAEFLLVRVFREVSICFLLAQKKAKENEHCNGTRLNYYFELQMEGKNNFNLTLKRELFLDTSLQMGDILQSIPPTYPSKHFQSNV